MTWVTRRNILMVLVGLVALSRAQDIEQIPLKATLRFGLDFVIVPGDSSVPPQAGEARQMKQSFFRSDGGLKFTKIDQSIKVIPDINNPSSYLGLKEEDSDTQKVTQE